MWWQWKAESSSSNSSPKVFQDGHYSRPSSMKKMTKKNGGRDYNGKHTRPTLNWTTFLPTPWIGYALSIWPTCALCIELKSPTPPFGPLVQHFEYLFHARELSSRSLCRGCALFDRCRSDRLVGLICRLT